MIKLGFSLQTQYAIPAKQVIELLKINGFSAVSPLWSPGLDLDALLACVQEHGMTIQSLHAPHRGIPLLWQPDDPQSAETQDNIMGCIASCARYQIPIMVIHGWQGVIYTFPKEPLNFRFFDQMVDYARDLGVCIAFENIEGEEYLDGLMTRYRDQNHIGFCWDSGHDHCYPHTMDFLESFGDRLIMTHLNDNLGLRDPSGVPSGKDDLHFLPYDGNIDWNQAMNQLKDAAKQDILNFEFKTRSKSDAPSDLLYADLSPEAFFQAAGQRARQIAQLYEKA